MDEEAQKRNTDCVYFLASPLTCKKGNECEYRHSESARVNPRDCWFWLSGNCLNPTCAFRHPPLEGLSGTPSSTPSQPLASAPALASVSLPASGNVNKPKAACYYFNQGFCAKGDKCPYMHGTFSGGNMATQKGTKSSTTVMEPQGSGKQTVSEAEYIKDGKHPSIPQVPDAMQSSDPKKMQSINAMSTKSNNFKAVQSSNSMTLQSNNLKGGQLGNPVAVHSNHAKAVHSNHAKAVHSNHAKAVQVPQEAKSVAQVRSQPVFTKAKRHNAESDLEIESTRQREPDAPVTRTRMRHAQPPEDRLQNGMEPEEWLGESSPGFDVLVDNGPDQLSHHEDADYCSNHDIELGRGATNSHERNMKREFARYDYDHPSMHDRTGYPDAEFQYEHGAYDLYKPRAYDHVGQKQLNSFDDRASERSILRGRRSLSIEDDIEQNSTEDLRHRLSKRRRTGAAKGAENPSKRQHADSQHGDFHHGQRIRDDEHRHHDVTYRDQSQQALSHSNRRLHGRIQMDSGGFKRDSFDNADSEYEGNSERFRSRSPPGRRGLSDHLRSNYRGKDRGRMLVDASVSSETRGSRGQTFKNNETRTDTFNFAGPKTLAQIKEEKKREKSEEPASSIQSRLHGSSHSGSVKSEPKLRQNLPLEERKIRLGKGTPELSEEAAFEGPKPLSDILKAKRKAGQGNDDFTENRFSEDPNQSSQESSLGMKNKGAEKINVPPLSEKEVEEGELPEGDDYASDPPTMGEVAEDVKAYIVDAITEHNSSSQENGIVHQTTEMEDTVMNEDSHRNEDEDLDADREEYDLEHTQHEENEEWQRNADQMQEDDEEDNYIEDDDDDDFAKKLGGIFS